MDQGLVLDFVSPDKVTFIRGKNIITKDWQELTSFWSHGASLGQSSNSYTVQLGDYLLKRKWFKIKWVDQGRLVHVTESLRYAVKQSQESKHEFEQSLKGVKTLDVKIHLDGLKRILTSEQANNVRRSLALRNGANFSVPGAGKTTTTLAIWNHLVIEKKVEKLLVICPKSAFEAWSGLELDEVFQNTPQTQELSSSIINNSSQILLSNYEKLENEEVLEKVMQWMQKQDVMMVLDEAHRIKGGAQSVRWRACKKLAHFATRVELLTGTPMPQGYDDLRNLFNLSWGSLPDKYLSDQELSKIRPDSVFVRTTKKELNLPPVEIKEIPIEPSELQVEVYSALRQSYSGILKMGSNDKSRLGRMGRAVMSLIAASTNPGLILGRETEDAFLHLQWPPLEIMENSDLMDVVRNYVSHEIPPKYKWLAQFVNHSHEEGKKTLVWSNFVGNLMSLERLLTQYNPAVVYGSVSKEGRVEALHRFRNDPGCSVLLTNPQTLGEGISLHRICNQAVYVDRTYNAGHYLQSLDRIHRLGLPKDIITKVFVLITNKTIDHRINVRLSEKVNRMAKMLSDESLVVSSEVVYDESENLIDLNIMDKDDADDLFGHLA